MYFDFWENRPDTPRLSSALTPREKVLLTMVVHLSLIILALVWPKTAVGQGGSRSSSRSSKRARARRSATAAGEARFVFMEPKVEMRAPKPPQRAELSDLDRRASSSERADESEEPAAVRPRQHAPSGSTPRWRTVRASETGAAAAAGRGRKRRGGARGPPLPLPESPNAPIVRQPETAKPQMRGTVDWASSPTRSATSRSTPGRRSFNNQQGGAPDANFPSIQFDSKGVEFGPWLRRFVAQIRRNWFIPYAAMTMKGHVVVTFNVHKDGRITDLQVMKPSSVDAFTNSAFNALAASNPTLALPPEYPDDKAFFTVTFYFNETPDR